MAQSATISPINLPKIHPSNLPRVLVHPEVFRGKGARGEAAYQRGGRGLGLTAKGCGKVLHLVKRTVFFGLSLVTHLHPVPLPSANNVWQFGEVEGGFIPGNKVLGRVRE